MSGKNFSKSRSQRAGHAQQHASHTAEQTRTRLAYEAARIMAEESVRDYATAKRKAAERLAIPQTKNLPSNEEIELELRRYLELFQGKQLSQRAHHLRGVALEAMRWLEAFDPKLVGPVLAGTVTEGAVVELHVGADSPEQIQLWFSEQFIDFEQSERRVRFGGDRYEMLPMFRFVAHDTTVELCVFTRRAIREVPLSPVDGNPMRRANLREVESIVNKNEDRRDRAET